MDGCMRRQIFVMQMRRTVALSWLNAAAVLQYSPIVSSQNCHTATSGDSHTQHPTQPKNNTATLRTNIDTSRQHETTQQHSCPN